MDLLLKDKTALVTGASVGIGRGIALALAAEGVRLAITARRMDKLREVADELVALGAPKLYSVANPFEWMEMISLQGKTNFFEKRVGEYSKAGITGKAAAGGSENVLVTDADF